jgi:hypothetical protein
MKATYTITVELPEGVSPEGMRLYIEEAVQVWCGRTSPDDPIFQLDRKKVKVKLASGMKEPKEPKEPKEQ